MRPAANSFKVRREVRRNGKFAWALVCDVDGVLTDGKFHYSSEGKVQKVFGSHDADALKKSTFFDEILFVSADKRGKKISLKRLQDMGQTLSIRDSAARLELVRELMLTKNVVFVGDSFSDIPSMKAATISAAPRGSYPSAFKIAKLKLSLRGGEGALCELLELFEARGK